MRYKAHISSGQALTLVEVLGATAVLATLATISVVSVRDSVQAGQKATMQREVQVLNTSLEEFRSAGGVISVGADVETAIKDLMDGVDLAGSDFSPLPEAPPMQFELAGEVYDLQYTPEQGFSYGNAVGDAVGLSGASLSPIEPIITNQSIPSVLNHLATLDKNNPAYNDLTGQLAIAMSSDGISEDSKQQITNEMLAQGYVFNPETFSWDGITEPQLAYVGASEGGDTGTGSTPSQYLGDYTQAAPVYSFDISDPTAVQGAMDSLVGMRGSDIQDADQDTRDYSKTIADLLAASQQGHANFTPESVNSFVGAELDSMREAVTAARIANNKEQWASLMNTLVKVLEVDGYYSGSLADFVIGQRMGRMDHNDISESFKEESVDWTVATPNQTQAALYQPTGANVAMSPVLGRVFKLESGDTLSSLFGSPETSGIVGGDTAHTAQRAVAMINGSAMTYYWNNNLNRWTRVGLGSPDVTNYVIPSGSLVYLRPAS